ncbi:MAG: glutathione S-transferase [Xanthomonadaceae bacterium]|nr:glutathione S-transferase [Xanthomonadaceae bacterium]
MDLLETRFPARTVLPDTPVQRLVARLLELYGDEWLLLPAMHYRWSFWHQRAHIDDVLEHFGMLLSPRAPRWLRRRAGRQFCKPFDGALPMLGITARTIPALEASYGAMLDELDRHFLRHRYLLGDRASIGDFGFIGPLYAHLGRDPYPKALMQRRAPNVWAWVQRMNEVAPAIGDWLPDDAIPDTLLPVLRRLFAEQGPVLIDTVAEVERWLDAHPDAQRLPRVVGRHRYRLGDVEEERSVFPYPQWMLQRVLDDYRALGGAARVRADTVFAPLGGSALMQLDIRRRVTRRQHRLVPEAAAS